MSRPTPLASVVVPSFNHERFVVEAVESVFAQSLGDFEIVVVDDGSSDASVERLDRFAQEPRFRLLRQENRGAHVAIARGIAATTAPFVFLLNSDDRFAPNRLARLVEALEGRPAAAAAVSWLRVVNDEGAEIATKRAWTDLPPWPQPIPGESLSGLGRTDLALLETNYVATTTNLAIRRELLPEGELLPLRYCHDWNLELALARRGDLLLVEEPLADYRVHARNTLREGVNDDGKGRMRFEILWVVARHASSLLARAASQGLPLEDLRARFVRSAPRFGRLDILNGLLAVAALGGDDSLHSLLHEDDPWRRAAVAALGAVD